MSAALLQPWKHPISYSDLIVLCSAIESCYSYNVLLQHTKYSTSAHFHLLMSSLPEGAVPLPHLHHLTSNPSWTSQGLPYRFPRTPSPSLLPMSPESLHSYGPQHDEAVPAQEIQCIPTSGWYGPSAPAPEHNQVCQPAETFQLTLTLSLIHI